MSKHSPNEPPDDGSQTTPDLPEGLPDSELDIPAQEGSVEVEVEVEVDEASDQDEAKAAVSDGPSREELVNIVHKLREEAKASRERMLRVAADADNLRKRVLKERKEIEKYSQENLLRDLLVPLDNLERTLEHIPEDHENSILKSLKDGLEMVLQQFWSALSNHNLQTIDASKGDLFDPNRHEAFNRKETSEVPPGSILSVLQRGYLIHDRLIRPVMVEVACAVEQPDENEPACSDQDNTSSQPETPEEK